jgi:hypothetical protein
VRNSDTLTKDLIKYGALQAMRDVVVSDPGPVRRKINKLMNSIFITFKTATIRFYDIFIYFLVVEFISEEDCPFFDWKSMCLSGMQKGLFGNEHSKTNSRNTRSPKLGSLNFEVCIENTAETRESIVMRY